MLLKLILHSPILGLILGPIITFLGDAIHRVWPWLDKQSPLIKQAFALVLSIAFVGLTQLVPGVVPDACTNIMAMGVSSACQAALESGAFLQAVISALVAIAVKHGQQAKAANATPT